MIVVTTLETDLSSVSALIGEPTRAAMLCALMDGLALPAGELAELAGVSPQTASTHLQKLLEGKLLAVESQGRHRYYRLSSTHVATAIEALMVIAQPRKQNSSDPDLCFARSCYDHLAGWLGVEFMQALKESNCLEQDGLQFNLTPTGWKTLEEFGLDLEMLALQRHFAKACLDWTERKHHLGGALGRAISARMLELNWLARMPDTRALRVTETGRVGLQKTFGVRI